MTPAGLLLRFAGAYVVLVLLAGLVMQMAGAGSHPAINMAVLLASVTWACLAFARKNGRYLQPAEKRRVVAGLLGIDVALQLLMLALNPPLPPVPPAGGAPPAAGSPWWLAMAAVFAVVALLHAAAIWWCVGWAGRLHDRQVARRQAARPAGAGPGQ